MIASLFHSFPLQRYTIYIRKTRKNLFFFKKTPFFHFSLSFFTWNVDFYLTLFIYSGIVSPHDHTADGLIPILSAMLLLKPLVYFGIGLFVLLQPSAHARTQKAKITELQFFLILRFVEQRAVRWLSLGNGLSLHRRKWETACDGAIFIIKLYKDLTMKTIFYRCPICGNILLKVAGGNVTPSCCGRTMVELHPNTTDGKTEYHVPAVVCHGDYVNVKIGKECHPMTDDHYIQFVYAESKNGGTLHFFHAGEKPEVCLPTCETLTAVYSYCNLHDLWGSYL